MPPRFYRTLTITCASLAAFLLVHPLAAAPAPTPTGPRWKSVAGDMQVAANITPGAYLPISDPAEWKTNLRTVLLRECNAATLLCYPSGTWTGPETYNFNSFNEAVNWSEANGLAQVAHLLVGGDYYQASWYQQNNYTATELARIYELFVKSIIQSNGNATKVDCWNVVNEAIYVTGPYVYRGTKLNSLGWEDDVSGLTGADKVVTRHPIWIRLAFEWARKYTNAKLELRDNNCEFPGTAHDRALYQLACHLRAKNTPVDVIGFQTHLGDSTDSRVYDWDGFKRNIAKYRALGFEVYITEVDIGNSNTTSGRERQRQLAYDCITASREAGVSLFNTWGLRDGELGSYRATEYPLFFETADVVPKPVYYGVQQGLQDRQNVGQDHVVNLLPTADTWVRSDLPTANQGTAANLAVQLSSGRTLESYLRFAVTGLDTKHVVSAVLRLKESTLGASGDTNGPIEVRRITGPWSEATTWADRPTYASTPLGRITAQTINEDETVDLVLDPATFAADGSYDLALISTTPGNDLALASRESATPPQLILRLHDNTFARWAQLSLGALPAADQIATADPDHDGLPNLLEYAQGYSPLAVQTAPDLYPTTSSTTAANGDTLLTLRYRRAATDLNYQVETTTDLVNGPWTPVTTPEIFDSATATYSRTLTIPIGSPTRFLRLHLLP